MYSEKFDTNAEPKRGGNSGDTIPDFEAREIPRFPSGMPEDDVVSKLLEYIEKKDQHPSESYSAMLLENGACSRKGICKITKLSTHYSPTHKNI